MSNKMVNKFRVAMSDQVDGKVFTFALVYDAPNGNVAGKLAMDEWGKHITEIRRVDA